VSGSLELNFAWCLSIPLGRAEQASTGFLKKNAEGLIPF
jgi:hypothetical protein